ncbi:GL13548 [Drosophila persimilis]|uniref:Uncharacterized protein Ibf2 n=2 Tax=pseudoobscura subgroup TaxID=32358 RepID=A0A6I8UM01_DROPS|nr:uncharacterized protein LOC4800356 [Drosophila pseudoobscura]XP_002020363.1 uncharacterized protein LOC6595036 [Drosophila persimilis]XP_017141499.1 uncharacterized protein LOC108155295 [Drosophila miranda]EDW39175.1 GL13548 [Drosophila persimilis]
MKVARIRGSSKASTWKRLGFTPVPDPATKKQRALCLHCHKPQANTSIDRLVIHRKSCNKYKVDLTEEFKNIRDQEGGKSEIEPKPVGATYTTSITLDKLLEDDDVRNSGADLEGYLTHIDALAAPHADASRLQKELIKAETEYLETKSTYFNKLNEIAELKRTVTMLEAKKTQLEIVKLRAECE